MGVRAVMCKKTERKEERGDTRRERSKKRAPPEMGMERECEMRREDMGDT
jgi:hypothetical protein